MQRQVQEGVAPAGLRAVFGLQRPVHVGQLFVILGVLPDPFPGHHLQWFHGGAVLMFVPDAAEVAADVGDGGVEEHGGGG